MCIEYFFECSYNVNIDFLMIKNIYINYIENLTLKISSDQIWVVGYFGQPLTYPDSNIFSSDFLCSSLKS
jgi:hypothetical protein